MTTRTSTEIKNIPTKHGGYMTPLAHERHAGLLFCWKIKQGLKMGAALDRIDNYIRFFWDNHLEKYFVEQEILLFNQLNYPLTHKGKCDHKVLSEWFNRAARYGLARESEYYIFVEMLTNHFRYEEREILPFLEMELPAETLNGIRNILAHIRQEPFNDNHPDEFWVKPKK
ncbi:MAG: hypothetical protein M3O71_19450 [Bacteroidota bacterium]|nr:hypothetical protein [Bacteroidota bacterium]